ncbi:MAG: glutamine-hydrolyzing carbamoyl-phosphate synthase small subunit [Nitrososphaerales archaeon]
MAKAILALEDGTILMGNGLGYPIEVSGEVVFSTGMTGYTESLTDPSYFGQILIQTYPLIGNYGVPPYSITDEFGIPLHFESNRIQVKGYVVYSLAQNPSHWACKKTLNEWLYEQRIPVIEGIDTRELTKKIRVKGTMLGILKVAEEIDLEEIRAKLGDIEDPNKMDLAREVTIKEPIEYDFGRTQRIVLMDCGTKFGIIRNLLKRDVDVIRVPYDHSVEEILDLRPTGIVISNGPGDPKKCEKTIQTVKELLEIDLPIMGVCLGCQILALAAGANTYKMKFGHRGQNHPCIDLFTNRCYITSQNHGYAVDAESLGRTEFDVWFNNVNDKTAEGIKHKRKSVFGTQFHPEASPGPYETGFLFDYFIKEVRRLAKA